MTAPPRIPTRTEVIRAHAERGGRVAAVLPVHHPRALWRAFDLLPIEVWGPPGQDTAASDRHLQAYACGIVRGSLSFLLAGGLEVADLIVVPHACDSLQGLGSVLLDLVKPRQPVLTLYMPRGEGPTALAFLADEIRGLCDQLETVTGQRPDPDQLAEAIEAEERADLLLARLHAARATLGLGERDVATVLRSREYLPLEEFTTIAEEVLGSRQTGGRNGIPIILSGLVPEPMSVLDVLERAGATVVADDLACSGRRLYPAGSSADPCLRMAESLLGAPPDSTRGSSIQARLDHLVALAEATGARAVVFHLVKFCEPELFYLPQLRRGLEQAGVRSLVVEVDIADRLPARVATQIEALLESVA
jgi:benzoyl-CoA reductase/2-hydroxyglutaryl-CoA dehydratase subunit BcrC/BadD/HgdB